MIMFMVETDCEIDSDDDDDVYYYICERLKLEGETENMGVCTKERKGVTAAVLMANKLLECSNVLSCTPPYKLLEGGNTSLCGR